jgi:hypothetical protein
MDISLPLLGGYDLGGFLSGMSLSLWYFVCLFSHRRRSPWSYSLGAGWLLFVLGIASTVHAQYTLHPHNRYSWLDGFGIFAETGLIFWWIALLMIVLRHKRQQKMVSNQTQDQGQSSKRVWPPPPAN